VTCTITNSRLPQLKVVKTFVGDTAGRVDLKIDTTAFDNGGAGFGTTTTGTGFQNVTIGTHSVSEVAHSAATDLANYSKAISCDSSKGSNTGSASLTTSALAYGDVVTCTITNTRLPTLTVIKTFAPDTDTGRFNLQIDGSAPNAAGTNAACGGSTGAVQETITTHTVSESAGTDGVTPTVLSNYDSVISGDCNPITGAVTLAAGDNKTCTITNTRKGRVTLLKLENGVTPTTVYSFTLTGGPSPGVNITKDTSVSNSLDFGLLSSGTYQLCENGVPAGTKAVLTAPAG